MKKIYIAIITICLSIFFILLNVLFETSLGQYIAYDLFLDNELTEEEKQWLSEHGSIIYGADENSPPLMFVDSDTGQYKGFTIDYTNALSLEIGADIKHKSYVWDEALEKLARGETDICDMFPSKERGKLYDFSDPIYSLRSIIMVSSDNYRIHNISDLEGKKVAIPKGDYGIEYLNSKLVNIDYIYTDNVEEAINKVLRGEADALLGDEPVVTYYIEKQNFYEEIRILDEAVYESDVVLAVTKGNKTLVDILNKGIKVLNNKQTIKKIQQKWFGFSNTLAKEKMDIRIFILAILSFSILIITAYLSYLWNKSLKQQVMKRTEELTISREELRITFDSITNLLIVVDNNFIVVDVNSSLLDFLKVKKENIIGKRIDKITNAKLLTSIKEVLQETFSSQINKIKEIKHDNRVYEIKTFPFKKNELELKKVIMMIEDVSNERMLENQILHSSKMAAIGQLAAGVAHEIRNPLGLIRNYTYLLDEIIDTEDKDINTSIKIIGESVERTSNIIDNLLNFSRIFDDQCQMTNIREFIEKIIRLEKGFMAKRKIKCIINCDKSINIFINRESLKHIIINLIGNAIDAMPMGGQLILSASISKNTFEFTCEDTGVGISEKDMESIFNPFFTKKLNGKGTGLGLYVVYNEIVKHGGEINVSSQINHGTKFNISLPIKFTAND